jgi:hypothetical protein
MVQVVFSVREELIFWLQCRRMFIFVGVGKNMLEVFESEVGPKGKE